MPASLPIKEWARWTEHLRELGVRQGTAKLEGDLATLIELDELGYPPHAVIAQSIKRGWRGFYELRERVRYHTTMSGKRVDNRPAWMKNVERVS